MIHASLHPEPNDEKYLGSTAEAAKNFAALRRYEPELRICFFGHTHLGVTYRYFGGQVSSDQAGEVQIEPGSSYLINPGSVGQPRDADPKASFVVFDSRAQRVRFHRVAYDVSACQNKAESEHLMRGTFLQRTVDRMRDSSQAIQRKLFIEN